MRGSITITMLLLSIASTANAQPSHEDLDQLEHALKHPKPASGLEAAAAGAPRWCAHYKPSEEVSPSSISGWLDAIHSNNNAHDTDNFLVNAAGGVCSWPNVPAYQHAATEIAQLWINASGMSVAEAEASLAARIDASWKDQHDALCKLPELTTPSDGAGNEEPYALTAARAELFSCSDSNGLAPEWRYDVPTQLPEMRAYLDHGSVDRDHDEIVRLAYVLAEIGYILDPNAEPNQLRIADYAVLQFDLQALDYAAALKQLDAPPYRGNRFAKTIVMESLARAKRQIAVVEALVAKRVADPKWKLALIKVPQGAAAGWTAAAAKDAALVSYIDSLAPVLAPCDRPRCDRATSPDRPLWHKVAHGCEAKLRASLAPILKRLPHTSLEAFEEAASREPLAGMGLRALAMCVSIEGDSHVADAITMVARKVTMLNGPRSAAFLATADAISALGRDAPFRVHDEGGDIVHHMESPPQDEPQGVEALFGGVVKSVTPAGKGRIRLTFSPETVKQERLKCGASRFDGWIGNYPHYTRDCQFTGKFYDNTTIPAPATIVAGCTAGIAPGRMLTLSDPDHDTSVATVYADKSGKKLVAAGCVPLE